MSTATVSHVLNGTRFVTEPTAARVLRAAADLGYRRSLVAAALRSKHSRMVGVVLTVPTVEPFALLVMQGLESVLDGTNYGLMFTNSAGDLPHENEAVAALESRFVDGLVMIPAVHDIEAYAHFATKSYPVVMIDTVVPGLHSVCSDIYGLTRTVIERMITNGHSRIGMVYSQKPSAIRDQKVSAYGDALAAAGLDAQRWVRTGAPTLASGRECTSELLAEGPTAIVLGNHVMMLGGLVALREAGVAVPGDVALVGFEDYEWMATTSPLISTITQDPVRLGREAAALLLDQMDSPTAQRVQRLVPVRLVDRGSF